MLKNTFCHIPGIGKKAESYLWSLGMLSWDMISDINISRLPRVGKGLFDDYIAESIRHYHEGNARYFSEVLAGNQLWRLFPDFRNGLAYVDIETTGLGDGDDYITTIALYDGASVYHYVHGRNLADFKRKIKNYKVIVTYSGKCFDVPFIENYFKLKLDHVHIDLRYILKALGYTGGLKGCERRLGIDRMGLEGVDGYFAVLLWDDFQRNKNQKALETLLAYNIQDVISLETLMVVSYNLNLRDTPFYRSHQLPLPTPPETLFKPDTKTIKRIRDRIKGRMRCP